MSKKIMILILLTLAIVALLVGIGIGININKQKKSDTIESLQVTAYRSMRDKCKSDQLGGVCEDLLIHDFYGTLNGESQSPDGYIFTFSNSLHPTGKATVIQVSISNNGDIRSVKKVSDSVLINLAGAQD